jgi:hypothetical protein
MRRARPHTVSRVATTRRERERERDEGSGGRRGGRGTGEADRGAAKRTGMDARVCSSDTPQRQAREGGRPDNGRQGRAMAFLIGRSVGVRPESYSIGRPGISNSLVYYNLFINCITILHSHRSPSPDIQEDE